MKDIVFKAAFQLYGLRQCQVLGGCFGVLVRLSVIDCPQVEMGSLVIGYLNEIGLGNRHVGSWRTARDRAVLKKHDLFFCDIKGVFPDLADIARKVRVDCGCDIGRKYMPSPVSVIRACVSLRCLCIGSITGIVSSGAVR